MIRIARSALHTRRPISPLRVLSEPRLALVYNWTHTALE